MVVVVVPRAFSVVVVPRAAPPGVGTAGSESAEEAGSLTGHTGVALARSGNAARGGGGGKGGDAGRKLFSGGGLKATPPAAGRQGGIQ